MSNQLRSGDRVQLKSTLFAAKLCEKFGQGTIRAVPGEVARVGEIFVDWDKKTDLTTPRSWVLATWLEKV